MRESPRLSCTCHISGDCTIIARDRDSTPFLRKGVTLLPLSVLFDLFCGLSHISKRGADECSPATVGKHGHWSVEMNPRGESSPWVQTTLR